MYGYIGHCCQVNIRMVIVPVRKKIRGSWQVLDKTLVSCIPTRSSPMFLALIPMSLNNLRQMPVVLPHDILNALHQEGRLARLNPPAALRNFWDHFHGQASSEIAWPPMAPPDGLPMGLHRDDARYLDNGAKIIAISMNFMLDAVQDRFPLVVIRLATWPIE